MLNALAEDRFHRQFTDTIAITTDIAQLPDMQGAGQVRDLREAASLSPALKDLLTQYAQATTRNSQLALLDPLLNAWAATSGLETLDARFPSTFDATGHRYQIDYQRLQELTAANDEIWLMTA